LELAVLAAGMCSEAAVKAAAGANVAGLEKSIQ
jgi:hypothetical protein